MENKDEKYSLRDVEILLQLKTWWASICVLPVANRIVVLIANNTKITPNQITLVSLLMRTLAGLAFVQGTRWFLTLGAFCYYLAYVLDCVDGPVARLTRTTSEFGRYLDHLSDLVGDMFILFGLAYGQDLLFTPLILAMLFAHVVEYYVSFLTGIVIANRADVGSNDTGVFLSLVQRYRNFFFSKNFKSFLSFPDYEAMVFVFFPLFNKAGLGLRVGFYLLILVVCYTIFSSFITVVSGTDKFP